MADKPIEAKPAVVAPAAATAPVAEPAKPALAVVFSQPTWQSTKPNAAKRLADVQLLGCFAGMPMIALAGITIAQEDRSVILYLPSASRVGSAKAVTARSVPATQTIDGQSETIMVPSRLGERQIAKLEDAIIDAWAEANTGSRNPYGVEVPLAL